MRDEEKGFGGIGDGTAAEAGDYGAAAGSEIEKFGGDAFPGEDAGDVLGGSLFVAGRIGGVDLKEVDEPVLGLQREGCGVSHRRGGLAKARGGKFLRDLGVQIAAKEGGEDEQNENRKRNVPAEHLNTPI